MDIFYYWFLLSLWVAATTGQNCKKEPRCRVSRIHGMKGADCFNKDMRHFPQCLSKDIEILDLSFNRIRKLSKSDLERYSDLKMLYLADNLLISIDNVTFENKNSLKSLDLSLNAISKLPPVVFHLPSLQSLYLGQNMNMNIADAVQKAKPITSPLVQLDISYIITEEPDELPDLGQMPYLVKLNISGNKLSSISPALFAGLCSLELLDTTNVTIEYEQPCECWSVNKWLRQRNVKFTPFDCAIDQKECSEQVVEAEVLDAYSKCRKKVTEIVQKSRFFKIVIPIVIVAVLLIAAGIYFVLRRRRQIIKKTKNRIPPVPDGQMLI